MSTLINKQTFQRQNSNSCYISTSRLFNQKRLKMFSIVLEIVIFLVQFQTVNHFTAVSNSVPVLMRSLISLSIFSESDHVWFGLPYVFFPTCPQWQVYQFCFFPYLWIKHFHFSIFPFHLFFCYLFDLSWVTTNLYEISFTLLSFLLLPWIAGFLKLQQECIM